MPARCSLTLKLPPGFRPHDILSFHGRDSQQLAERVGDASLEKGMLWCKAPAKLSLRFTPGQVQADMHTDASLHEEDPQPFAAMVSRMLGLHQPIEGFEQRHAAHPQLGRLIARNRGLRVALAATPFEALTWAITGQQISVNAAVALRRKLIQTTQLRHSSGLLCYPNAQHVAALPQEALRQAGFSATKTRTLQAVSRLVVDGALPLEAWAQDFPGADLVRDRLLAVRGIGPWTVNYALLRGHGWLDGSLHGDAAVRRGLQTLLGSSERIDEKRAEHWLAPFSPWRALVGAHLWAMQSSVA